MHTVLGLVKYLRLWAAEYLVGNFHLLQAKFLVDLATNRSLKVVERRQAVQEDSLGVSVGHHCVINLIWAQQLDALLPQLGGLTHRYPNVGVDNVGILGALLNVVGESNGASVLLSDLAAGGNEFSIGHVVLTTTSYEVDTELSRNYHQ